MKKLICMTMCLCAMIVALSSCSGKSGNGIYGKWEQKVEENGMVAVSVYDFKESGEMMQSIDVKCASPETNIVGSGTCRYTYADDTITFKFSATDFDFSEFSVEGLDDATIEIAMERMKSEVSAMEQQFTGVKIESDVLTADFNGQTITLKRI